MGMSESEIQTLCLDSVRGKYGDNCKYEHLHTSFLQEEAFGLVDTTVQIHLLKFQFSNYELIEIVDVYVFSDEITIVKSLCDMLINTGRKFGNVEFF